MNKFTQPDKSLAQTDGIVRVSHEVPNILVGCIEWARQERASDLTKFALKCFDDDQESLGMSILEDLQKLGVEPPGESIP